MIYIFQMQLSSISHFYLKIESISEYNPFYHILHTYLIIYINTFIILIPLLG